MPQRSRPSPVELAILRVIWTQGPSTGRQIHEELIGRRPVGYTTPLKRLQIMAEKGLVTREEQGQHHVYRARYAEKDTQRRLLRDLLERAFGGSTSKLGLQALATKRASPEELREIRRLLASKERGHD